MLALKVRIGSKSQRLPKVINRTVSWTTGWMRSHREQIPTKICREYCFTYRSI